mmetsp:Transcript_55055/g.159894  ORF Transcript_55055/g.159894 Transcript_55055/m.159894 type:complete len:230 (+) Transcript_55055:392-1081(+)
MDRRNLRGRPLRRRAEAPRAILRCRLRGRRPPPGAPLLGGAAPVGRAAGDLRREGRQIHATDEEGREYRRPRTEGALPTPPLSLPRPGRARRSRGAAGAPPGPRARHRCHRSGRGGRRGETRRAVLRGSALHALLREEPRAGPGPARRDGRPRGGPHDEGPPRRGQGRAEGRQLRGGLPALRRAQDPVCFVGPDAVGGPTTDRVPARGPGLRGAPARRPLGAVRGGRLR